jgi:cytochrome b subunit of formate dehydrogenase
MKAKSGLFRRIISGLMVMLFLSVLCPPIQASDPEGCLVCHRYRGLGMLDEKDERIKLFYVDPTYYDRMLGPHARLRCTDCHERTEVAVLPHKEVSPVNCTQSCHLSAAGNMEMRYGHDRIGDMLEQSVHPQEVLETCNQLLGKPLATDQSRCLLCHDEPTYRRKGHNWAESEAPVGRCNVCHDGRLPVDTRHYYWHVQARSKPARSNEDQIRVCAVCHSNEAIREKYELPDSTASYLASFHGKAALLGSEETAGCLDCHVSPIQNVHQIESHETPGSSSHTEKLADTCRTAQCHPHAGKKVGSASVHLELSTSRGIEFFIATIFVLMIIGTFGPSALLTVLHMFQVVVGRHDPDDAKNHHRAEALMAHPKGQKLLKRFTVAQRLQHWILVLTFFTLVLTGFPMKFADRIWARWLIDLFGGLGNARIMHRVAGALLLIGFAYHFVIYVSSYILKERKRTQKSYLRIFLALPMVMNPSDFKKMGQYLLYLFFIRRRRPQWGRFSLEEKFEYFGVLWGTVLLGVTGIFLWDDSLTTRFLPGRTLTVVTIIHSFEAYLALLHVGIVHLANVLLAPGAFPCSPAMFTGNTPVEEIAEIHPAMLDEAETQIQMEPSPHHETPPKKLFYRILRSLRVQVHALIVLLIVAWAVYMSVAILFRTVFQAQHVPEQFLEWQDHLSADTLRQEDITKLADADVRAPMGHYHGVKRWYQPDPLNGCTIEGCHAPMPHKKNRGVRAFDNFHATFLACQYCHEPEKQKPIPASWVNLATGDIQNSPAVLKLLRYLEQNVEKLRSDPDQAHEDILKLLKQTIEIIGTDPVLDYLLVQIDTSEPGSPVWNHAVDQLTSELPQHVRGEYGAKVVPREGARHYQKRYQELSRQARQYFDAASGSKDRSELLDAMHESQLEIPHKCLDCHGEKPGLLDFEALGYSPQRTALLQDSSIARQMQKIQNGEEFYILPHPGGQP